ncbi:hypothetical protein BN440_0024 [Erwinia amylovora MR1]|nr:hypothetical protein BN440_0024 [Erwinia amylovora MR1]
MLQEGIPANHHWNYPDDALDNDHWLYAGRHPGTMEQPKDWYEYGKAGCIYYDEDYGYLMLKTDGRPSDYLWYFPKNGESGIHWRFIKSKAGTFRSPLAWSEEGMSGNVYYSGENEAFYLIKKRGIHRTMTGTFLPSIQTTKTGAMREKIRETWTHQKNGMNTGKSALYIMKENMVI